jgi:Zn-dependent protease with chaperone function
VKIEPPAGIEITASQAPELFATINELSSKLGAPRFNHVLITDELNAGILQLPRLGAFGWYRNYLMIGLPLMKSLTCDQFKAVLAHELGHLAKGHGIVSHSVYRQRLRWSGLMAALEASESRGRFLFMPFLNWFVPYFGAFSFPLARANEYEADVISVRLTSSRATAEALTSIEVVGGYLSDFYWPVIDAEFGEQLQPSREPYSEMSYALATRLDKVTSP